MMRTGISQSSINLGTAEWHHTKSKVKAAVEEVAQDLVELYAKRQQAQGFPVW